MRRAAQIVAAWIILLALLQLAACGGGDPEPDADTLPVDCKAIPEACA